MSDPLTPSPLSGPVDECAALRAKVERLAERESQTEWLDDDGWLRDQHARYHDQPGNMMGLDDCGWERCDFWHSAVWVLNAPGGIRDARRLRDEARAQLAEVKAVLPNIAELIRKWTDADRRAAAAEARLEAVQAVVRDIDFVCPPDTWQRSQWWDAMDAVRTELRKALAVSPPEPEADEGCCDHSSGMDVYGCWDCRNTGHAHPADEPCAAPQPVDQPKCEHGHIQVHELRPNPWTRGSCPGPVPAAAPEER